MQTNSKRHNDDNITDLLPKITEEQYRIIIMALHTLEKHYPKDTRISELTDLVSTQTIETNIYSRLDGC